MDFHQMSLAVDKINNASTVNNASTMRRKPLMLVSWTGIHIVAVSPVRPVGMGCPSLISQ